MRSWLSLFAALSCAAFLCTACGEESSPPPAQSPAEPAAAVETISTKSAETPDTAPMLEAYLDVLEGVYYDYALPDGTLLHFFEQGIHTDDEFAIFDVDGDGADELLIRYVSGPSAGMLGMVYGYDAQRDRIHVQLQEFPALNFYQNGAVEAGWSHNQGMAGRFWPCTYYQYDPDTDTYAAVASVDAWDREFFEFDFDGNPFPADVDTDGDNIVYYICPPNSEEPIEPISHGQFTAWQQQLLGGAPAEQVMDIPFIPMTEENIAGIL